MKQKFLLFQEIKVQKKKRLKRVKIKKKNWRLITISRKVDQHKMSKNVQQQIGTPEKPYSQVWFESFYYQRY